MGFGGSKIVGHSGTSFKHRKAFTKLKKFNELTEYSYESAPELNDHEEQRKPIISRSHSKNGRVLEYVILTVIIIVSLFLSLYFINVFNTKTSSYLDTSLETYEKIKTREDIRQYEEYTLAGFDNLRRNNLEIAQLYFVKALEIETQGKEAREGVTEVLQRQCELWNKFCPEYEENLSYLIAMNYDYEFVDE